MKPLRRYCIQNAPLKTLEKDSWHVKMLKSITNKENLRINGGSNKKVKTELLLVETLHGKKFNHQIQNPCAFVALFLHFYMVSRFSMAVSCRTIGQARKVEERIRLRHLTQFTDYVLLPSMISSLDQLIKIICLKLKSFQEQIQTSMKAHRQKTLKH